MSNDIEREAFERQFPVPAGAVWAPEQKDYTYAGIRFLDRCVAYSNMWEVWQAARAQQGEAAPVACPGCDTELADKTQPEWLCEGCRAAAAKDFQDTIDRCRVELAEEEQTRKTFTDKDAEKMVRAFWRRIYPYRNDYDKELPDECPVEFGAHMSTALMALDLKPVLEQDQAAPGSTSE